MTPIKTYISARRASGGGAKEGPPRKSNTIAITIITSLTAICASIISAFLTNHFNMQSIEASSQRRIKEQIVAEERLNKQKTVSAAKLVAADIIARLNILEQHYTDNSDFIFSNEFPGLGSMTYLENSAIELGIIELDDIDRFWSNSLAALPTGCAGFAMDFYRNLYSIRQTRKTISAFKKENVLPQISNMIKSAKDRRQLKIMKQLNQVSLGNHYLLMHRYNTKSIYMGYEALAIINIEIFNQPEQGEYYANVAQDYRDKMTKINQLCQQTGKQIKDLHHQLNGCETAK